MMGPVPALEELMAVSLVHCTGSSETQGLGGVTGAMEEGE